MNRASVPTEVGVRFLSRAHRRTARRERGKAVFFQFPREEKLGHTRTCRITVYLS